jgi:hypothetical protein
MAPTAKQARLSHETLRAPAANASATDSSTSIVEMSDRRSYLSPRGTKNSIPRPVPICVSMATAPI